MQMILLKSIGNNVGVRNHGVIEANSNLNIKINGLLDNPGIIKSFGTLKVKSDNYLSTLESIEKSMYEKINKADKFSVMPLKNEYIPVQDDYLFYLLPLDFLTFLY